MRGYFQKILPEKMKQKRPSCPISIMRRKVLWKIWNKTGVPCHYNITEGFRKIILKFWDKLRGLCRYYIVEELFKNFFRILDFFGFRVLVLKWKGFYSPPAAWQFHTPWYRYFPSSPSSRKRDAGTDDPQEVKRIILAITAAFFLELVTPECEDGLKNTMILA